MLTSDKGVAFISSRRAGHGAQVTRWARGISTARVAHAQARRLRMATGNGTTHRSEFLERGAHRLQDSVQRRTRNGGGARLDLRQSISVQASYVSHLLTAEGPTLAQVAQARTDRSRPLLGGGRNVSVALFVSKHADDVPGNLNCTIGGRHHNLERVER
jgi:hypothetical protein